MLNIRYVDNLGRVRRKRGVASTSFHRGRLTAELVGGGRTHYGPMYDGHEGTAPVVEVFKGTALVERHELRPAA